MRFIWLLIALLLLGGGYLYLYPDAARQFRNQLPAPPEFTRKTDHLYKWRNSAGEWQVTDAPPPEGTDYERLDYRDDQNVLPVPPGIQGRE